MDYSVKKTIVFILWLVLFVVMCSCSKNYHLKRSRHHYEKAIAKGYQPLIDTTYVYDTVRLTGVQHDTIFTQRYDTVKIEKERLRIAYKYDTVTNEVYIDGECLPDTLVKRIPITTQKTVYIEQTPLEWAGIDKTWEKILFWVLIGVCILLITLRFIASYAR